MKVTLGFVCLLATAVWAESSLHPQDAGIEVQGVCLEREEQSVWVFHRFSGTSLRLHLDLRGTKPGIIGVRLFQKTQGLAMPLGKEIEIGRFLPQSDHHSFITTLCLPITEKRLELVGILLAHQEEKVFEIGHISIFVYPEDLSKPLKALSQKIVVFGERNEIRSYLQKRGVAFREGGPFLPSKVESGNIYIGDASSQEVQAWSPKETGSSQVVIFTKDENLWPGVYQTNEVSFIRRKVTLPLLDNLDQNPLSETTFVSLLSSN